MARRRFFVEQVRNGRAEIAGEEARHLTRVLRVEVGQVYEVSDNNRAWLAEVETARKEHVVFRLGEALPPEAAEARIVLLAALIKFDHFEWLIEKATELGVNGIVPVRAVRSEHGLERAAQKRIDRWRRIAVEASQQSRRTHLPAIELPVDLRSALATPTEFRAFLDEEPGAPGILSAIPGQRSREDSISLLVGPEGGWTDDERGAALDAGWTAVSMGPRILRAETAAIAGLAALRAAWDVVGTGNSLGGLLPSSNG